MTQAFLPAVFNETQEFDLEKLNLLYRRGIAGLSLAACCTVTMLALLAHLQIVVSVPAAIALSALVLLMYPLPALFLRRQLPEVKRAGSHRTVLKRYTLLVLGLVVIWDGIAIYILPQLAGTTRIIIICLYAALVFAHFLPLAMFPRHAFAVMLVNLLPMAIYLTLLGDPLVMPLGLAGITLAAAEALVIAWNYRTDMDQLEWRRDRGVVQEPDMSESGFAYKLMHNVFFNGIHAVIIQVAVSFVLVIVLREPDFEAMLWTWFLLVVSLNTLRAASHIQYLSQPQRYALRHWRRIAALNILLGHSAWWVFFMVFYADAGLISAQTAIALQTGIAVISVLGLGADRVLLYLNALCCLVAPTLIASTLFSAWMVAALLILTILTLIVGLENIHRMSLRSLESQRLHQLAEFRATQMQALNIDLTHARKRLTDTNTSLEAQVQERTRELQYQAEHDMLTGLGNRYRFSGCVEEALQQHTQSGDEFAVYLLDLNRFKEINDGLGHFAGDRVLQETAHRIRASCVPGQVCARWGGDEFVILQQPLSSRGAIQEFANNLLQRLEKPIELESGPVLVGASIGVAVFPDHGDSAQQLLEHADIAVYRAKCNEQSLCVYEPHWGAEASARLKLAQKIRTAIAADEFEVALQPFIASANGNITGFEALARWPQPEGPPISPGEFIPIAEECGLMPMMGQCILLKACHTLKAIAPSGDLRVAVNISVSQLLTPNFQQEVMGILQASSLPPTRLELEVTENLFANDIEQIRAVLNSLRQTGIRIAIDDFGTGYSSISYLRHFPIDTLKIDRSFVTALNDGGEAIYSSIVSLANSLNLHTIVEGVETEKELSIVMQLGGAEVQGFYFAKPMFKSEVTEWLNQHHEFAFRLPRPQIRKQLS